jgi:hypothetical protein
VPSTATALALSRPLPPRKVFQLSAPVGVSFAAKASFVVEIDGVHGRAGEPQLRLLSPATYTLPVPSTAIAVAWSCAVAPRKVFQLSAPADVSFAANPSNSPSFV